MSVTKKKSNSFSTYTKKAVKALLIVGVVNAEVPYVLSLLGKEPVMELGIAWITEIVSVILGYMCKAYFENKQEKKQKLAEYEAGMPEEEV